MNTVTLLATVYLSKAQSLVWYYFFFLRDRFVSLCYNLQFIFFFSFFFFSFSFFFFDSECSDEDDTAIIFQTPWLMNILMKMPQMPPLLLLVLLVGVDVIAGKCSHVNYNIAIRSGLCRSSFAGEFQKVKR